MSNRALVIGDGSLVDVTSECFVSRSKERYRRAVWPDWPYDPMVGLMTRWLASWRLAVRVDRPRVGPHGLMVQLCGPALDPRPLRMRLFIV